MFKNIAPRRFIFSIILIAGFIALTLYNLSEADKLFADIQKQLSDGLGWLIILLANGFLVFVIYLNRAYDLSKVGISLISYFSQKKSALFSELIAL